MLTAPMSAAGAVMIAFLGGAAVKAPADSRAPIPPHTIVRHQVRMDNNRFTPRRLVIQVGDEVEFLNGAGGPHNVAFWPDSVPAGAPEVLRAAMPDTIGPLIGPLIFGGDERYLISFAGAPPGTYHYYCLPHVVGGMVGELEVTGER